ncbi:DUF4114 domain-containing protein [Synechococcus sp. CS-1331]|uniref:DUF4114 domain-containing protein n=1 Tax=Synechococcus sp. CS-1331 TaxID=2847973 RepID=UPI00223A8B02|nr:DUF4114 domain-containing protein [Synechococcus sp. CS-1331]MCT0227268.1 DUF4114 domain-containing protein [Synechococcus sp. CS-1331]
MTAILANTWIPSGNDYVIDGLWGRLGVQENFGETYISGATNGLTIKQTEEKVFLYAGASNGGVHLRVYDKIAGKWGDSWSWISKPGSGYTGSQSIGVLSISDDGKYLAVGQGNPSNDRFIGAPSQGIQIGAIQENGSVQWLPVAPEAQQKLANQNIRSMEWIGAKLSASSWSVSTLGSYITVETSSNGIDSAFAQSTSDNLYVARSTGTNTIVAGGYDISDRNNVILFGSGSALKPLKGEAYLNFLKEIPFEKLALADDGKASILYTPIARVTAYPSLVDGKLIAFAGFYQVKGSLNQNGPISHVARLVIDPETQELASYQIYEAPPGEIGTNQASNMLFYGNFSLAVDPHDPTASSVFAGGNQFGSATLQSPTNDGGLVRVDFSGAEPSIRETLYGPKIDAKNNVLVTPFSPGQPHADSRTIAFYESKTGPKLVQSDDGGIWELALQTSQSGSKAAKDAWWQSLSTKGLSTLETNMVSWASQSNSIASSYQDNAASLGYYGDDHATNFWVGDGQLAFFDDGINEDGYAGFLSSYGYLNDGSLVKAVYNKSGFISSREVANFYLKRSSNQPAIPWTWTAESQDPGSSKVFLLPTEPNAYKSHSIVFSGLLNIYETIKSDKSSPNNAIILRPLLESEPQANGSFRLNPTAIDNQGGADEAIISSLYVGASNREGNPAIYGRTSNSIGDYTLKAIDLGENQARFISNGSVVDLAHSHRGNADNVYWIQGGNSLSFSNYFTKKLVTEDQVLGVRLADGTVKFYNLKVELGLPFIPYDSYGYQALVFVPGNTERADRLVIGGLTGIWSAELDEKGIPSSFQSMPWQNLPEGTAPGSYIKTIQYDPQDDILIAGTQGQGSFIYSFTGDLGERPAGTDLLHISNVDLPQKTTADLDKRGNQENSTITIQLDSRLREPDSATTIEITLHDADAWREAMDYVSPYDIGVNDQTIKSGSAKDSVIQYLNILDPRGLAYRYGREESGNIIMPLTLPPGVNLYNLIINQKEFASPRDEIELGFSVRTIDGLNQATATLSLFPEFASTRASFYSSSLAFDGDKYINGKLSNAFLDGIRKDFPAFNFSGIVNEYSLTPVIDTGMALIPTYDPRHQIRPSFSIDTFNQLKIDPSSAIASPANSSAWLFAANVSMLPITYDPTAGFGARFYDLSEDGYADRLSISANASQEQFTKNVSIGFGSVVLDPLFQAVDPKQVLVSGLDPMSSELNTNTVNFRISANLEQRASVSGSLGYMIFNPNENFADFNFTLFQNRARDLITSLGSSVDLSAMPEGFDFSSEILANNGQRLMFFEVEGASLDQLSSLNDPRLHWLDTNLAVDGKSLSLSTPNGATVSIAITPGFQGVDPLIADLQNQAPILDLTAFASDQRIDLSLGYGREAALDSVTGWYLIQSKDGAVTAADGNTLRPGDPNYINEALRTDNQIDSISGISIANRQTRSLDVQLSGGVLLAPYTQVSNGETYVAFAAANSDGLEHFMSLGTNLIGFEDLPNGGDRDFQDAVWKFDFAVDLLA